MRRFFTFAFLIGFAAPFAASQQTPGFRRVDRPDNAGRQEQLAAAHDGYQRFLARNGGAWMAHFDEDRGWPTLIAGSGIALAGPVPSAAAARAAAGDALARLSYLWGVPLTQLSPAGEERVGNLYFFSWKQQFDGLEVWQSRAQIQMHASGRIAAVSAMTVPIPEGFDRNPKITAETAQAVVAAGKQLIGVDSVTTTDLVIYPQANSGAVVPKVAFVVMVSQPSQQNFERVFVDATTLAILEVEPLAHDIDVKGKVSAFVNAGLGGSDVPIEKPLEGILVTVPGVGTAVTDSNGNYLVSSPNLTSATVTVAIAGPYYTVNNAQGPNLTGGVSGATPIQGTITANFVFNTGLTEFETAEVTAAYHAMQVRNFVKAKIPTYVGFPQQAVNVNLTATCNAYYEGVGNSINFYNAGNGCTNSAYSTIVYHEYGHGVDDYYFGIPSGSLSEAIGDIHAMYLTGQPIVGQDFKGPGTLIRTGENTKTWPASSCGGEPHCVGETYMGFAWQLYKILKQSMGAVPGAAQAEQIVIGTLPAGNANIPDAVTQVFILDDNDGNLANGTPHYVDIAAAALMKGFTPPQLKLISVQHSIHPDTFNQTKPYPIYATITAQAPAVFGAAFVDYSVNGGATQTVPMAAAGGPNVYVGYIPPQVGPAIINYWIRAQDQVASTQLFPTGGDNAYRFAVGKKTVLFADKMENGTNGWTHVQASSADDWMYGKPQNAGTNPYDPPAAYSGNNCWGNDLQLVATDDGLYNYDEDCYLETPTISATGKTGVRLRFRRWLTIERGQNDKATVLVNNSQLYLNPTGQDLFDTQWVLQDFSAPSANNVAAFKARWRLKSDLGIEYGGWNIDDVEVYALETTPVLNLNLSTFSPTPYVGSTMFLDFDGTPNGTFELYAALGPGPAAYDGYGVIEVDPATIAYFLTLQFDGTGHFSLPIPIPYTPALVGLQIYWVGAVGKPGALPQVSNVLKTTFQ